jgi:hypothetical protein
MKGFENSFGLCFEFYVCCRKCKKSFHSSFFFGMESLLFGYCKIAKLSSFNDCFFLLRKLEPVRSRKPVGKGYKTFFTLLLTLRAIS